MFADFNSVFKQKPQSEMPLPQEYIDFLSSELPKGTRYISNNEDGSLLIAGDGNRLTLGGFSFVLPKKIKEKLGDSPRNADVLAYLYNAQKSVKVKLDKEGYITINGEECPVEKLVHNPLSPLTFDAESLMVVPQRFPAPIKMEVGDNKYIRKLFLKRIPNEDDADTMLFQSEENESLVVRVSANPKMDVCSFSLSYHLEFAHSVRDIIETVTIYNAFCDGVGFIDGKQVGFSIEGEKVNRFDERGIIFWQKALRVEEALHECFVLPVEKVEDDDYREIERLYQNLICGNPIREAYTLSSLSFDGELDVAALEKRNEKAFLFEGEYTYQRTVFGVDVKLPTLILQFNSEVESIREDNGKYELTFRREISGEPIYLSSLAFVTEQERDECRAIEYSKRVAMFRDAKSLAVLCAENNTLDSLT